MAKCTCATPCCEADIGIGVINCGSQHCLVHGLYTGYRCFRCGKTPQEAGYQPYADDEGISADEYVYRHEGTLNTSNGHFACDECYIAIGQPTAPYPGWKAP